MDASVEHVRLVVRCFSARSSPSDPPFAPSKSKSYAWSLYTSTYDTVTSYVAPSFARRAISENSRVTALGTMPLST